MNSFIKKVNYSEKAGVIGSHYHDQHQLLYVINGNAEIKVDREVFKISKGDLVIISRTEAHSMNYTDSNYSRYEIRISPEILTSNTVDYSLYSILLNRPQGFSRIIKLPIEEFENIFKNLYKEYKITSPYSNDMISILLKMLFIKIYRINKNIYEQNNLSSYETVRKIQQMFDNDVSRKYCLDEIAREHHLSKYYLSHTFKAVTGYPVMDYLKMLRINKAKTLLSKTELSISEIVSQSGYSDCSNFCRDFKKATSVTPKEFRKIFY